MLMADDLISHLKQYVSEKPKARRSDPPEIRQRTPSPQHTDLVRQNVTPNVAYYDTTVITSNVTKKQPKSLQETQQQKDTKPTALLVQSSIPTRNIVSSQSAIVPTNTSVSEPNKLDKEVLSIINKRLSKIEKDHDNEYAGYGYQYPLSEGDKKETTSLETLGEALKNGTLNEKREDIKVLYEHLKIEAQKNILNSPEYLISQGKKNNTTSPSSKNYQAIDTDNVSGSDTNPQSKKHVIFDKIFIGINNQSTVAATNNNAHNDTPSREWNYDIADFNPPAPEEKKNLGGRFKNLFKKKIQRPDAL